MMKSFQVFITFCILTIFTSCNGQGQNSTTTVFEVTSSQISGDTLLQIIGEIRGIIQDSKNNLWFVSNGNGVFKYDGKTIINYTEKHGLSSNYVWMAKEGNDGKIWFKTNIRPKDVDAICSFDGVHFKTIPYETSSIKLTIFGLCTSTKKVNFG